MLLLLVLLGLCLGSFVNALVWRLHQQSKVLHSSKPTDKGRYSILLGRSMCPNCHHELALVDLVPVLSWLALRGKCRYCGKPISWQYPIVELLVSLLFGLSYIFWPLGFNNSSIFSFVLWLVFLTLFVALAIYDLKWYILPDRIVYPLIGLALIEVILKVTIFNGNLQVVTQAIWGVLFISGLFYLIYIISNGSWIGFGDVKLAIVLGLLVGGPLASLVLIFFASIMGTIVALPLLLLGRARTTTRIPFGPFLLLSTVIVVLLGSNITNWYNSLFYLR